MPLHVVNVAAVKIIKNTNYQFQNIEKFDLCFVLNYHHRIEAGPPCTDKAPVHPSR